MLPAAYHPYLRLARVDKPVGYFLLLWPVLWALWMFSAGLPDLDTLFIFVAGVFIMRSCGCVINDYFDRDLDSLVQRTKDRPLANRELEPKQALYFFFVLAGIAFALVLLTNLLTVLMALVAILLVASYPLMKRIHSLPQLHLAIAFSWAIPMVWTAVVNNLSMPSFVWLLYLANVSWVMAYDTIYALADRDDDLKAGIKSSAILFGSNDRLTIGLFQLATVVLLATSGYYYGLGAIYANSLVIVVALFIWQQFLIEDYDAEKCIKAFKNNVWVGGVVLLGMIGDLTIDFLLARF